MTDLTTLHDAFAELERRADAGSRAGLPVRPAAPARASRRRPVLIGVTVAALLAAVGGAAVFADGRDRPTAVAAGGPSTSSSPAGSSAPPAVATPSPTPAGAGLPTSTDELRARFQAVLGDLATFEVTSTNDPSGPPQPSAPGTPGASGASGAPGASDASGASGAPGASGDPQFPIPSTASPAVAPDVMIIGVLTAAGVTGGFDVQTLQTDPGTTAWCATDTPCTVTTQPDGTSLAIGVDTLLAADGSPDGGTLLEVNLIHPDGAEVLLHLSNQRDPKGMSEVLAPQPPLTTDQLIGIVSSPLWLAG